MRTEVLKTTDYVNEVVDIHLQTFTGFFLTFLGKGFLRQLYKGFITHDKSNIIVAIDNDKVVGFVAYSENISEFYKYLIKKRLISFAWYSFCAFLRKPRVFVRLLRALTYSKESKREEAYVELSSIGVLPEVKNRRVGSLLIDTLKKEINFEEFNYIKLETDKVGNDVVNAFYVKKGFVINNSYTTREGREMNEYRFMLRKEGSLV